MYVVAHLYDRYGTFLIGLTTRAQARWYNYPESCLFSTLEKAEWYVRQRLARMEELSRAAYERGERSEPKGSRGPGSSFLRQVLREALTELDYDSWVEQG